MEYTFTSEQLWALRQMFAFSASRDELELSQRMYLIALLDFTEAEREQIQFEEETATFISDAEVTRELSRGQKKKLLEVCRAAMPNVMGGYYSQKVLPAIQVLGYKLPEPKWGEDD